MRIGSSYCWSVLCGSPGGSFRGPGLSYWLLQCWLMLLAIDAVGRGMAPVVGHPIVAVAVPAGISVAAVVGRVAGIGVTALALQLWSMQL